MFCLLQTWRFGISGLEVYIYEILKENRKNKRNKDKLWSELNLDGSSGEEFIAGDIDKEKEAIRK